MFSGPSKVETDKTVEIYTWKACPYCWKAKKLLNRKGVAFQEHAIDGNEQARAVMIERANGKRSLPRVFIEGVHIGGCDDLHSMEQSGKLDEILTEESAPT